eukprot:symbB.v1.2.006901.t1/scaffold418.1/size208590/5
MCLRYYSGLWWSNLKKCLILQFAVGDTQAVLDEQSKLQHAEAQIQELQKKLSLESLQAKAILEEQEKRKQAILGEQEKQKQSELEERLAKESQGAKEKDQESQAKIKELEERLAKESLAAKEKDGEAHAKIKELEEKLAKESLAAKEKDREAEAKIKELEERLAKESLVAKEQDGEVEGKIKELQAMVDEQSSLKEALLKEQEKRKETEAKMEEMQNKLASESLQAKAILEEQQKRKQAEMALKEQQEQAEVAIAQIKELQAKIDEQSSSQEAASQSEVHLLQRRLASTEQRLLGEEQCRKVAEDSRLGAERRLQEMEEMLTKSTEKLAQQSPRNAQDEAARKKLEIELKQLQNVQLCKKAEEEKVKALQARVHHLEAQLVEMNSESQAKMMALEDQWLSKEQAAKEAADAEVQALQTQLAFQQAAASESLFTEKERQEMKGALEAAKEAKEAMEVKLQAAKDSEEAKMRELHGIKSESTRVATELQERIKTLEAELEVKSRPEELSLLEDARSLQHKNLELREEVDKLDGTASDLRRRLGAAEQRLAAEQHRRETAEGRTKDVEDRLATCEEDRSMSHLQGKLEAAMIKANREAQAKTVAQRQLVAALKAATAAGAKLKAAETVDKKPHWRERQVSLSSLADGSLRHPVDFYLEQCIADWDNYQKMFKEQGCDREYVPYPYTREMIEGYFKEYNALTGISVTAEGPPKDAPELKDCLENVLGALPAWAEDRRNLEGMEHNLRKDKGWWSQRSNGQELFRQSELTDEHKLALAYGY